MILEGLDADTRMASKVMREASDGTRDTLSLGKLDNVGPERRSMPEKVSQLALRMPRLSHLRVDFKASERDLGRLSSFGFPWGRLTTIHVEGPKPKIPIKLCPALVSLEGEFEFFRVVVVLNGTVMLLMHDLHGLHAQRPWRKATCPPWPATSTCGGWSFTTPFATSRRWPRARPWSTWPSDT